jgi:membrane associated rhomboid family serine protease
MTRKAWLSIVLPPAVFLAITLLLPCAWQSLAEYDRAALIRGEWWRLWTGHLVHADMGHASGAACAWMGLAFLSRAPHRMVGALLVIIAPLMSAALLALPLVFPLPGPALDHYRGASGLLFVWMTYLLCNPGAVAVQVAKGWRYALALALTVKLAWDLHAWLNITPSYSTQVAGDVHLMGAVFGAVFALCVTLTAVPGGSTHGPGSGETAA